MSLRHGKTRNTNQQMAHKMSRARTGREGQSPVSLLYALLVLSGCCVCQACDITLTSLEGSLQSPQYPAPYPPDMDCVTLITLPPSTPPRRITLTFHHFQLQPMENNRCLDLVEVRDGDSRLAPLLSQYFCGTGYAAPTTALRSSGSSLWVRFVSDHQGSFPGYNASYSSDTSGDNFTLVVDTKWNHIYKVDMVTTSFISIPLPQLLNATALDYDPRSRPLRIFWIQINDPTIYSARLDGSDRTVVCSLGHGAVLRDIAVDAASNLIFYVDGGNDVIGVASPSTGSHRSVVHRNLTVKNIVVDCKERLIYWTEGTTIQCSAYDGSNVTEVIQLSALVSLQSLAMDTDNGDLYWLSTDHSGQQRIETGRKDGTQQRLIFPKDIHTPGYNFSIIAVYASQLFVVTLHDEGSGTSSHLEWLGADGPTFVWKAYLYVMTDIALFDQALPLPEPTKCRTDNGGCSDICIPLPDNSTRCMCPDGHDLEQGMSTCSSGTGSETSLATSQTTQNPKTLTAIPSTTILSPTTESTDNDNENNDEDNLGIIIGSAVAAAVGVAVIIASIVIYRQCKTKTKPGREETAPRPPLPAPCPERGEHPGRSGLRDTSGEHAYDEIQAPGYMPMTSNSVQNDVSNVAQNNMVAGRFPLEDGQGYLLPHRTRTPLPSISNPIATPTPIPLNHVEGHNEYIGPDPLPRHHDVTDTYAVRSPIDVSLHGDVTPPSSLRAFPMPSTPRGEQGYLTPVAPTRRPNPHLLLGSTDDGYLHPVFMPDDDAGVDRCMSMDKSHA